MRLLQVLICLLLLSGAALADVYADCQKAIEAGDKAEAEELSALILRFNSLSVANQTAGAACLSYAKGKKYTYDIVLEAFVEPAQAEAILKKKRDEAAAKEAKVAGRRAAGKKIEAEREAIAAATRIRIAEERAKRKAAQDAKIQAVWERVKEVCGALYADDPTEALTRKVCLDLFLVTGLPAE